MAVMALKGLNYLRCLQHSGRCKRQIHRNLSILRIPYAKLKEKLVKYEGGSVDLEMDDESGIATVTINNPEKSNAFTGKMMADFDDCVRELEDWSAGKGVILTGKGNTFCSGADLNLVRDILDKEQGYEMSMMMHDITLRFLNLPLVSVAAVAGSAVGGGAELTTACDFRVMSHDAKIAFVHVKLHAAPGWGGAARLTKLLGRTKALQLLVSGKVISAKLGHNLGLVNEIVPEEENILDFTQDWLAKTCVGDPAVSGVLKSMVIAGSNLDIVLALEVERQMFKKVWGSLAHREAVLKKFK